MVPCRRAILLQKTKLGKASHSKWAWRPTTIRQGVLKLLGNMSHNNWAGYPTTSGQDVPVLATESILQFGGHLARLFFPRRCSQQLRSQAMAASEWLNDTQQWQGLPWYAPPLGHFQFFRQNECASQVNFNVQPAGKCALQGHKCPIL